jgi:mRNA interferase HicA
MKRKDLVRYILSFGCLVEREGNSHTIFINPTSGQVSAVPRHKEINTFLGKKICKDLGLPTIHLK